MGCLPLPSTIMMPLPFNPVMTRTSRKFNLKPSSFIQFVHPTTTRPTNLLSLSANCSSSGSPSHYLIEPRAGTAKKRTTTHVLATRLGSALETLLVSAPLHDSRLASLVG